jgi:hypothetical protein
MRCTRVTANLPVWPKIYTVTLQLAFTMPASVPMASEEWGKLLGDVLTASAILDRFLHHAQTVAITGRSYRLKDHATIAGKEDKNKKTKSKPNEPSTAEPAS